MELGGGIFLDGFEVVEPGKLIVVKKIVGNYTKSISEKIQGFSKIKIRLIKNEEYFEIFIEIEANENLKSSAKNKNLFFALDNALGSFENKID